jgi:hypothetical protein
MIHFHPGGVNESKECANERKTQSASGSDFDDFLKAEDPKDFGSMPRGSKTGRCTESVKGGELLY